jgi:isopentenyl-diphosphate Delta-isomerase
MEKVIVVDEQDNDVGAMEKMEAHKQGVLHRAFSVVIFNSKGEMLLQKRASEKYHSGGLWTNACCSHPMPGERIEDAVHRRLREEMGMDTELKFSHKFIYRTLLEKDLIEYELDHVFTGTTDDEPVVNSAEVEDWKYADPDSLKKDMLLNAERYTYWFRLIVSDPKLKFR